MSNWWSQEPSGVRFEWGPAGAEKLAAGCACIVIVDVLSFTTSVTVAVERGIGVFPHPWRDDSAARLADEVGAALAVDRSAVDPDAPWSLSPDAIRRAPMVSRLVLPSPNGSTIAAAAADSGAVVIAACLRNAAAVGRWLSD